MQHSQRTFFFQVKDLHQSVPVWCLLLIARYPQKKINAWSALVRSWLRSARAGGTDYLVIILTPWGEREVSWSCNVTFDFKHSVLNLLLLNSLHSKTAGLCCTLGGGVNYPRIIYFKNTHEVFLHMKDLGINNLSPHALPLSL